MRLDYTNPESLTNIVEALIFATDEPLSALEIRSLILDEQIVRTEAQPDIFAEPNTASGGELAEGTEAPKKKKAPVLPNVRSGLCESDLLAT